MGLTQVASQRGMVRVVVLEILKRWWQWVIALAVVGGL
jgi:hypothetical protein